ncbi:MAG TPA: hypothetical protein PKM72_08780, partial [Nitrospirales bacterium]|nr:hypothetical protein [Nitrospirales bacterium]
VIDILAFSDGVLRQVGFNWNADNDLEMLRQFWDCTAQAQLSLIISHNGPGFIWRFRKTVHDSSRKVAL